MRGLLETPFAAVVQTELLINSKRVAPYALFVLFAANAVLWMTMGAASHYGWAVNSDFYIVRNFQGFSFITGLPIFTAVIMGDCVVRDFRLGVDPLIFSKPVGRGAYLLGKFCGNFLVLVCCLLAFALTQMVLQVFPTPQMVVLPIRVLPYFKHFFFLVVISQLAMAAFYFTVGTLTRNAKVVYGLAVAYYPLYIAYQVLLLEELPPRWRSALDPYLVNWGDQLVRGRWENAAWLDQLTFTYTAEILANRAMLFLFSGICLAILYARFRITDRSDAPDSSALQTLNLASSPGEFYYDVEGVQPNGGNQSTDSSFREQLLPLSVAPPHVDRGGAGARTTFSQLLATVGIEFRLQRAEKSLVVLVPLAMLLSFLALPFTVAVSEASYSASYAGITAKSIMLFLLGVIVFYTGEAMHRERELRVEPVLWSVPAPNNVLLLPKFLVTMVLALFLILLVGLVAIVTQVIRGHTPVEISTYLIIYLTILLPSVAFITACSIAMNVFLREKYLTYAVSIAIISGLFYLYNLGYNHWLYNPVLYQLWTESDLAGPSGVQSRILLLRVYCLALSAACLALAHLGFKRKVSRGIARSPWALLTLVISIAVGLITILTLR